MSDLLNRILAEKTDAQLIAECEWQAERVRLLSQGLTKEQIDEAWETVFRKLHPPNQKEATK